jgi:3alpha(or 20beta)-hydroxysteroid dehydrogenase
MVGPKSSHDLSGKVILVTGGARGLGAASARALVEGGAKVFITDIDKSAGESLSSAAGDRVPFLEHDVSDAASWGRVVDSVLKKEGRLDGLLNNAAIFGDGDIASTSADAMDGFYKVNQLGVFFGMQAVLEPMKNAGRGVIINMSSAVALRGLPGLFGYSASKWAVRGMTRCAAVEFAPFGIRVNAVFPGQFTTRMLHAQSDEAQANILGMIPFGRFGKPEEMGDLMQFLMSDQASYMSGAEIVIDGAAMA